MSAEHRNLLLAMYITLFSFLFSMFGVGGCVDARGNLRGALLRNLPSTPLPTVANPQPRVQTNFGYMARKLGVYDTDSGAKPT